MRDGVVMRRDNKLSVTIALGGNAILRRGDRGTASDQLAHLRDTAKELVKLVKEGDRILLTHGNGPQVGDILIQNDAARELVPPMPLDVCGAESQGMIGYLLQQALEGELGAAGLGTPVATVLTQVLVDRSDPAFRDPTKPVGPFYTASQARGLAEEKGWAMMEDAGRGYRRIVPSPKPKDIVEAGTITRLFESGTLVIAAGGGGIPVARAKGGRLEGVEAVLDKDRTAALLGTMTRSDILLILTDVDGVYLDYGTPEERKLDRMDLGSCRRYLKEGQFPPGSMGPKVESATEFLRAGGSRVVISSLRSAGDALAGRAGTTIERGDRGE